MGGREALHALIEAGKYLKLWLRCLLRYNWPTARMEKLLEKGV
jgi:hypothetical protein